MVSSHWIALASHSATYAGSNVFSTHVVTCLPKMPRSASSSRLAIMVSEHSRGELLACCHSSAITGSVQKRERTWGADGTMRVACTARSVAVEGSLHEEKQRLSSMVAVADASRGSRLSVLDMA